MSSSIAGHCPLFFVCCPLIFAGVPFPSMTFYYVCIPWIVYWSQIVATDLRLFCSARPILLVKQRFPRDVALVFNQSENTYACRIYKLSSTVTTYFHWHTLEKHWYLLSRKFLLNCTRKEVETMRSRWKGIELKIIESIWLNRIHWMNKLEKPKLKSDIGYIYSQDTKVWSSWL